MQNDLLNRFLIKNSPIRGNIIKIQNSLEQLKTSLEIPEQIKEAQQVPLSDLKDPQPDSDRVQKGKEQWLVTIAVCTHLGCVPSLGKGDFGGSLCPCHGSQYDTSQRIRYGPAPKNLEVPSYVFLSDTRIKIG